MTEDNVKEFVIESEKIILNAKKAEILHLEEIPPIRAIQLSKKTVFYEKELEQHETNSAILSNYQYK